MQTRALRTEPRSQLLLQNPNLKRNFQSSFSIRTKPEGTIFAISFSFCFFDFRKALCFLLTLLYTHEMRRMLQLCAKKLLNSFSLKNRSGNNSAVREANRFPADSGRKDKLKTGFTKYALPKRENKRIIVLSEEMNPIHLKNTEKEHRWRTEK